MTSRLQKEVRRQFRYVFFALFQPVRLAREFEPISPWLRFLFMLKAAIPMFLIAYPASIAGNILLAPFGLSITEIVLTPIIGIAFVIASGVASGIAFGIAFGIASGIASGIAFNIVGGIAFAVAFGIAASIAGYIILSLASGVVFSSVAGIAFGIQHNTVVGGIMVGITINSVFILGVYRMPLYLVSGFSSFYTYLVSRQQPHEVLGFLRRSSVHWDECVYPPLPFLKQTLLIACDQDLKGTLEEIAFIAAERPQQLRTARAVALEIVARDMESRKTVKQIAGAAQRLKELLPPETNLSHPRWDNALLWLSDAKNEMMRSMQPIEQQARFKALDKMRESLDKIPPNIAFSDKSLNRRLKRVIEVWCTVAEQESERLKHAEQYVTGNIGNPYKPGQVLEPNDPLFVGRRDLAVQLEDALSRGSRRPTLLLQGERRMGKTSTLYQLPNRLGASYIPILYNLQDPKIYASISTFLGKLANDIFRELSERGIKVKIKSFAHLLGSNHVNDPIAYSIFDNWLANVQTVLEEKNRSLLLAFDEFEKLDEAGEKGYLDLPLFLD